MWERSFGWEEPGEAQTRRVEGVRHRRRQAGLSADRQAVKKGASAVCGGTVWEIKPRNLNLGVGGSSPSGPSTKPWYDAELPLAAPSGTTRLATLIRRVDVAGSQGGGGQ